MTWQQAPNWQTTDWLNTKEPLTLEKLRGRVVMLHAFQMLCPGCVARSIPQAQRVAEVFADAPLAVVGLHTVFEHHQGMRIESLRAFIHEYRIQFPVGVDAPGESGPIPKTMEAYRMRGTPTTVLIDAQGRLRHQIFGGHDDLLLGGQLQSLILEASSASNEHSNSSALEHGFASPDCDDNACVVAGSGQPAFKT